MQTTFVTILGALLGVFVLGGAFGDVDDLGLLYLLAGGVVGLVVGRRLPTISGFGIHGFLLLASGTIALLLWGVSLHGILTNTDIRTGLRYDGMAGMTPYLIGGLALIFSLFSGVLLLNWFKARK